MILFCTVLELYFFAEAFNWEEHLCLPTMGLLDMLGLTGDEEPAAESVPAEPTHDSERTNIATGKASFYGSVHSGGAVSVEIGTQYGSRSPARFFVEPSIHSTGRREVTVQETKSRHGVVGEFELPTLCESGPECPPVEKKMHERGCTDSGVTYTHSIDTLVIVSDSSDNLVNGDDEWLCAFDSDDRFTAAHELRVVGAPHKPAELEVLIDTLIVM